MEMAGDLIEVIAQPPQFLNEEPRGVGERANGFGFFRGVAAHGRGGIQ